MCTGAEIALVASAAASAGGQYLNGQNANKNAQAKINARNASVAQEQQRQKGFQAANDATLNDTLASFNKDNQDQTFGDLVAQREQAYAANTPASAEFANISDTTPQVVKGDLAKRVADKMAESKASAKALAKIGATTDVFQGNGLKINSAANNIGTTNSLARGSLQTNATEQTAAANNAGNSRSTFGDLLSAGGAIGATAAGQAGAFNGLEGLGGQILQGVGVKKQAQGPFLPGTNAPTYNDWGALNPF